MVAKKLKFKNRRQVPCRSNYPDVGCAAHGYAICDYCVWTSPNLRREPTPKTKCGQCGKASQGYTRCKTCEATGVEISHLFDDAGDPTI